MSLLCLRTRHLQRLWQASHQGKFFGQPLQREPFAVCDWKQSFWDSGGTQRRCFSQASLSEQGSRLRGRTCLITGGTSGIGFAIARRFLLEGADQLILLGRSRQRLVDAALRLEQTPSLRELHGPSHAHVSSGASAGQVGRVTILVGDVSDAALWTRDLEGRLEPVDILVNAAGISISGVLARAEPADVLRVLRTNLEGSILSCRAFMRATIRSRLKNRNRSHSPSPSPSHSYADSTARSKCIINISSLLALKGGAGAASYAASKAGVLGLTRAIAAEAVAASPDTVVRANAIVPGYVDTPMISGFSADETRRLKATIPMRRFGDPAEIADAAVFLALNEYANNCVLNIDGGFSAL